MRLIRSLSRDRVRPYLCLLNGEDELSRSLEPGDCPVLRLGIRSLLRPSALGAVRRLGKFWRTHRIDIVQTYFLDSTYFGAIVAKLCGIRRIVRVRNNLGYWMQGTHRHLARWMGKLTDITLTNCDDGKQAVIAMDRLTSEKVAVLENGVDLDRFPLTSPPDLTRNTVRIGAVGNLRPVKNIDGLIRVAAQLCRRYERLRFEVAGEGEQRADLERSIAERGLQDIFHLRGSVGDVPGFLADKTLRYFALILKECRTRFWNIWPRAGPLSPRMSGRMVNSSSTAFTVCLCRPRMKRLLPAASLIYWTSHALRRKWPKRPANEWKQNIVEKRWCDASRIFTKNCWQLL